MIELRVLGEIGLRDREDGREIRSVVTQRKRVALLAYLALAPGEGWVSRDTLLGLFWPEASEERARHSLSQALYVLRRGLGRRVVESRGHQEVRTAPGTLWCDVEAFEAALDEGDREGALELYPGPLLDGLHVAAGPRFEKWLDRERRRLHDRAASAAGELARALLAAGDAGAAERWARRSVELDPFDETAARQLIRSLAAQGDRAAAVEVHRRFENRLQSELGLESSAEILALAEELKAPPPGSPAAAVPPAAGAGRGDGDVRSEGPGPGGETDEEEPTRPLRSSRAAVATALLAAATIVLGVVLLASGSSGSSGSIPSIAVLPFEVLDSGRGDDALTHSLHGELVSELARLSGLTVIARPAVRRFRGSGKSPAAVGRELEADAVLSGRARRVGDRLRLDVELVEPNDETVLWKREYDRRLSTEELTRLESEIVGGVSSALRARMDPRARAMMGRTPTASLLAYEEYQRGRDQLFRFHDEEQKPLFVDRALELFRRAIGRDPAFAEAHAGIALAFASRFHLSGEARWLDSAYTAARRARLLGPELAEAHLALGYAHWAADSNRVGLEHVRRAVEEKPSSYLATLWMVTLHDNLTQYDEGLRWARRLVRLDPNRPSFMDAVAWELRSLGLYDAADAWARHALELQPDYRRAVEMRAYLLALRGQPGRGLQMLEEYVGRHPSQPYAMHHAAELALMADRPAKARDYFRRAREVVGRRTPEGSASAPDSVPLTTAEAYAEILAGDEETGRAALRAELERARGRSGDHTHAEHFDLATVHAALGENESALDHLEAAYRKGRRNFWWMKIHPLLKPLRTDPRYRSLAEKMRSDVARMRREVLRMGIELYPEP